MFSVGARRPAWVGFGAAVVLIGWQAVLGLAVYGPGREYVGGLLLSTADYFLAAGLGHGRGRWRAARQAAADRLARAEAGRQQASAAERQRLARELHVNALLTKLGVRDRVQATILAYDLGLVRPR